MMLPYDPILSPIIVIGVFVYFACKMVGENCLKTNYCRQKSDAELQDEEYQRQDEVVALYKAHHSACFRGEYNRYIIWLYEHRDGRRPPTIEEIVEDYGKRREAERKAREEKRLSDWYLFKQSPAYKKEMERIEKNLNR